MSSAPSPKLFSPIHVGTIKLEHRVVLAPLTRFKANPTNNVPITTLVKSYYSQRASVPGTLLIAEANLVSPHAGGRPNTPGIWSQEQIKAWKEVVADVHAKGSFFFMQIRAMGRAGDATDLAAAGFDLVGPSPIPIEGKPVPRELTVREIHAYLREFADAAENAVARVGCDGMEMHFANGYMVDQFIQDVSNQRTDEYGGSIDNRNRFALEIVEAVVDRIGQERTAVRLSPWGTSLDMGMADPVPQFSKLIEDLRDRFPGLAYLHLVEPRINEAHHREEHQVGSNDVFRRIWAPRPLILAGGFTRDSAIQRAEEQDVLIAFGRHFISNPDLPVRLKHDIPLTKYDRATFYVPGIQEGTEKGYIDYPFAETQHSLHKL